MLDEAPRCDHSLRAGGQAGFTLIELVLAVGLLGGSFLGLLYLRTSAMDRAHEFNQAREVKRVARQKLEEVVYGFEEATDGDIEDRPRWTWEVQIVSLATTETQYPLLEATLTLHYPGRNQEQEESIEVTTRFFADEDHPLRAYADQTEE